MKVLLIDNLVLAKAENLAVPDLHPHLGLLALATTAEAAGHTVEIIDPKRLFLSGTLTQGPALYEQMASLLLSRRPQVIGFTALGCSFLFALNTAAAVKCLEPDLPILLGGPHATMLHRQILERFPSFDLVVRYEADETFPLVLDRMEQRSFDGIPGLSWRTGSRAADLRFNPGRPLVDDLDKLPIASYDHYPIADLGLDLLRIEAGRGCPFACTFCSTAGFFQRRFRLKTAPRLLRELDLLNERYGYTDFKLDHDLFTVNRRKVVEFCDAVMHRGYRWRASARIDCVDETLLRKMADAGCVELYFGIESGSARIQETSRKRLCLDRVLPTLAVAEQLGIGTTVSFITGYPEERLRDQNATLDLLGRCLRPGCLPQLHVLAPEPGTPMYQRHRDRLKYDGYSEPYAAPRVNVQDEELVREHKDIFQTSHYYPAALPRERHLFAAETVEMLRRIGPHVLSYTLRAFGGRLSRLVGEFWRYRATHLPETPPDASLIESFITAKFGAEHHLLSLFRYGFACHLPAPADGASQTAAAGDGLYRLGSSVRVLHDLHDCAGLLRSIRNEPGGAKLLDTQETDGRASYLVSSVDGTPLLCRIDKGIEMVLELFKQPRTFAEAATLVCGSNGEAAFRALFDDLTRAGVVVAGKADFSRQAGDLDASEK